MIPKLKDRQHMIPGGFKFYLQEIKFTSPGNFPSFTRVCDAVQRAVEANDFIAQKNKWPTDRKGIEDWVDLYNATLCLRMGWDDYIATDGGGSAIPKSQPQHQQETLRNLATAAAGARELIAGAKTLIEWDDSGAAPVSSELSTHRAIICAGCPKNEKGDYTRWFTIPAAELIKRRVEKALARKLTTPRDDQLNICTACHCPLKLKVHIPFEWIVKRITQDQKSKLDPRCWILSGQ